MDDFDSMDGESYSEDDDYCSIDSTYDEEDGTVETDDDAEKKTDRKCKNYTILTESDILKRQEESINQVSSALSVSKSWASLLLRKFQWNVETVSSEWFADEDRVRKIAGLVETSESLMEVNEKVQCFICFETCCYKTTHAAMCGHRYCDECWDGYISTAILDGPACLSLRCPHPDCHAAINRELIAELVCDEHNKKYDQYLFRSYVEDNKKTKWCPGLDCECAAEFDGHDGNFDVWCICSHEFCYNCNEERHRPVNCDTVSKWVIKNSSESENTLWILANSKPCPKCRRNIEKNQGCNHMTCKKPCGYQFCWVCLGDWKEHKDSYHCNVYDRKKLNGTIDEEENTRERAKHSLEKYTHYYERWLGNHKSMVKAAANVNEVRETHLPSLRYKMFTSDMQLEFIIEAWLQIIECRRMLKWTYAYGYYLPEHNEAKKQFFEYAQGDAESALEKLHECAETEILVFLKDKNEEKIENEIEKTMTEKEKLEVLFKEFQLFGNKLGDLTRSTKTYFDNLVRALENNLSDVSQSSKQTSREKLRKGRNIYAGLDGYTYSSSGEDD